MGDRITSVERRPMSAVPSFGRTRCGKCKPSTPRWAYYFSEDGRQGVCGHHAPRKPNRRSLPKDEAAEKADREAHLASVETTAAENRRLGKRGTLECRKMMMMKKILQEEGKLVIFPNFKHAGRKDGMGLPALSPKAIGPVHHGQPGLPRAENLENFHQGSKWFDVPREEFEAMRLQMYRDKEPRRHNPHSQHKNIPKCFVWMDTDGVEHQLSYVESRQFYCWFYSKAVQTTKEFHMLQEKLASGVNLVIYGYDGYQPDDNKILEHYEDASRPFGHELVLYTMLKCPKSQWPWLMPKHNTFPKP